MQEPEAAAAPERPSFIARHMRSFPVYVGSGGVATASHYVVTIAAVELFSAARVAASAGGFAVGAGVKYWLNYVVAFRSRAPHASALARYALVLAAMLALNTVLFAALQGGLGLHYLVAQAITTILLIPPGYVISRRWVFR
jgi:putative flippase GtrA